MNLKVSVKEAKDSNTINYVIQSRFDIQNEQYGSWEIKGKEGTMDFVPRGAAVYIEQIINYIDSGVKYYILRSSIFFRLLYLLCLHEQIIHLLSAKHFSEKFIIFIFGSQMSILIR